MDTLTARSLLAVILALGPFHGVAAQEFDEELPARGGEQALRRSWVELHPEGGAVGELSLTHEDLSWTQAERATLVAPRGRWQPSRAVWSVLETTHPLQFEADDGEGDPRWLVPAGRYVVHVQNDDGAAALVLTEIAAVRRAGLRPGALDALALLGGYVLPASGFAPDVDLDGVRVTMESYRGDGSGGLTLHAGAVYWNVGFTALARNAVTDAAAEPPTGTARLERHLARVEVPAAIRRLLLDPPGRVQLLALQPEFPQDDAEGKRLHGDGMLHGFRILDSRTLDLTRADHRATVTRLQALLRASTLAKANRIVEDCFEPAFAIRATTAAGNIDLVLSFRCAQGHAWLDDAAVEGTLYLVRSWLPEITALFEARGLTIER